MNNENKPTTKVFTVDTNPFLLAINEFLSTDNLTSRLSFSPLDGVDVQNLSIQERLDLLDRLQEEYFEPTSTSLDMATRLYRLIRRGYINRDPRVGAVRKLTMELSGYAGTELNKLPWFTTNAKGMTISGITGLGKSYEVERALKILPQVIEHGECPAAGWKKMKQVIWLKVGMSHDGSLGGLLMQILSELDRVIGTSYSQDKLFSRASNEKMAVMLGIVFRNHGVGVLVIDEIQERNFQRHGRGEFSATFFLRLLNFGIPVVLIGNTFGIRALDTFSQDMRRIGSGGTIELHPIEEGDFDWENCLAPAIISLNLMPDISTLQNHKNLLFKYSGGIRDYAFRIQISSQRLALDLGHPSLTEEHIDQAFLGSDFSERERALISGFRDKNPLILTQFEDVPWDDYAKKWGLTLVNGVLKNRAEASKSSKQADSTNANEQANPKPAKPVAQNDLEKAKRNRTRKNNAASKSAATKKTLESNDMRADGLKEVLIRGMESAIRGGSL